MILRTVLDEWNAFTGGIPSHVPAEVLGGATEILTRPAADDHLVDAAR